MNNLKTGTLYIVPTPIGNLNDISYRIIEILSSVNFIICEDTRRTLKLLNTYNIKNKLISYYKEIEEKESNRIINLLLNNNDIAIVSDSGTPLISDPGSILINKAIKNNINIISIPGPTALISAVVASGFDLSSFTFYGFLNNPENELMKIKYSNNTTIIYESPHRLYKTLETINKIIPDRNICIAKEISKINESYYRGKAKDLLKMNIITKGEFVIIIEKNSKPLDINNLNISLPMHLEYYVNQGFTKKEAIKQIASDLKLTKNEIYKNFFND